MNKLTDLSPKELEDLKERVDKELFLTVNKLLTDLSFEELTNLKERVDEKLFLRENPRFWVPGRVRKLPEEKGGLRIAFGCQARVGKDTAVKYLIDSHEGVKLSFASPIYDILTHAQTTCGFSVEKDRKFLQWIGTWAREKDSDVWVKCLMSKVTNLPPNTNIFVSDLRFPNEFKALKKAGFTCVRLVRVAEDVEFGSGSPGHVSETALLKHHWDFILENHGTVHELYSGLDYVLKEVISKEI